MAIWSTRKFDNLSFLDVPDNHQNFSRFLKQKFWFSGMISKQGNVFIRDIALTNLFISANLDVVFKYIRKFKATSFRRIFQLSPLKGKETLVWNSTVSFKIDEWDLCRGPCSLSQYSP